jgi:hypothetical protein
MRSHAQVVTVLSPLRRIEQRSRLAAAPRRTYLSQTCRQGVAKWLSMRDRWHTYLKAMLSGEDGGSLDPARNVFARLDTRRTSYARMADCWRDTCDRICGRYVPLSTYVCVVIPACTEAGPQSGPAWRFPVMTFRDVQRQLQAV